MKSPELQSLTLGQRELISDVRSVHKSHLKKVSFPRFAVSLIHILYGNTNICPSTAQLVPKRDRLYLNCCKRLVDL